MIFLTIVIAVAVICILVKRIFSTNKKQDINHTLPNGMQAGNVQIIGEKDSQNDYFATTLNGDTLFSAIADGLTNKKAGKFAAVIAIESLKSNFANGLHKRVGVKGYFTHSIKDIEKSLHDNIYGNKVGVALVAVLIENGIMHFLSLGNCPLLLYRNSELIYVNDINSTEAQISLVQLEINDVVMLCSKGASESLTEREITCHLSQQNHPYSKCQALAKAIRQKAWGNQDNATVIILEKMARKTPVWVQD